MIGQEFSFTCQLLGRKLKPVATLLISEQNDFLNFFPLNNLPDEVCPLLQIENLEFRLYWKRQNPKNCVDKSEYYI